MRGIGFQHSPFRVAAESADQSVQRSLVSLAECVYFQRGGSPGAVCASGGGSAAHGTRK